MQVAHINTDGLEQIASALGLHHKMGGGHFTAPMLSAWASEAEASFENGNGCCFEIRGADTNSGRPVEVSITSDGYSVCETSEV